MRNIIFAVLVILIVSSSVKTAAALTATSPVMAEATADSKPAALSIMDQLWLSVEPIIINGVVKANVLVNRITRKVEYAWSGVYGCYTRPKFSIPNVQSLYDIAHPNGR